VALVTFGLQPQHAASTRAVHADHPLLPGVAFTTSLDRLRPVTLLPRLRPVADRIAAAPPIKGGKATAPYSKLPSFGRGSEALAINEAGTVIVGHAWDRFDVLHAMKWTWQNGSWTSSSLPRAPSATSAIARGVNNQGDAAGNDFPGWSSHAVLWPHAGGFTMLGCSNDLEAATVHAISAAEQMVVGQQGGRAAVWQPGRCRAQLPPLGNEGFTAARAVNADGTIVGGVATVGSTDSVPVRWTLVAGQWVIEQLDSRVGGASGANTAGDLVGHVSVQCASADGCQHAAIWYAAGGWRELGTLGGEDSWARDINSSGEVVGGSTSPNVGNTGYFWSESVGMLQLPFLGRWAAANAVSDVRPDGTRLVVGMDSQADAIVWIVRNP
jgi:uncharacterized membrane protein